MLLSNIPIFGFQISLAEDVLLDLKHSGAERCSVILKKACSDFLSCRYNQCIEASTEARGIIWEKLHDKLEQTDFIISLEASGIPNIFIDAEDRPAGNRWENAPSPLRDAYGFAQLMIAGSFVYLLENQIKNDKTQSISLSADESNQVRSEGIGDVEFESFTCQPVIANISSGVPADFKVDEEDALTKAMASLDMVLLISGNREFKTCALAGIEKIHHDFFPNDSVPVQCTKKRKFNEHENSTINKREIDILQASSLKCDPQKGKLIPRVRFPSTVDFFQNFMTTKMPVIITNAMEIWPAMTKWKDPYYLENVGRCRTVPVETGDNYLHKDSGLELMHFDRFVRDCIGSETCGSKKMYLAQHELFNQIPALNRDILTPDYCALVLQEEEESWNGDVIKQAWFGPAGTVSPLHNDPYHNFLAQVVGSKFIRIYDPSQTMNLYTFGGRMQNNSKVDVKEPNFDLYPRFQDAEYLQGILEEGEMLYIPPRFWHYITSLQVSFSVSFWWGKRNE